MKIFIASTALVLLTGTLAKADVGVRNVTCYSDLNNTVVFSGDYDIVYYKTGEPIRARYILGEQGGKCILGDEIVLPQCQSMAMRVYISGPPCGI